MPATVIIPARYGSTRLPGKPLASLGGVPMVVRTAKQAQKAKRIDAVWVATDHEGIADVVRSYGIGCKLTDPNHPSGTDRVWEVAASLDAEHIINLQGDEPHVFPEHLELLAQSLEAGAHMATLGMPCADLKAWHSPHVVKVVASCDGRALYFSRAPIPYARHETQDLPLGCRHIGIYGFSRKTLGDFCAHGPSKLEQIEGLEQLRALEMGIPIQVCMVAKAASGIDTADDLAQAQMSFLNSNPNKKK